MSQSLAAHDPNSKKKLNIAYLTSKYPSVSHTFIRRELRGLIDRGHTILRLSILPSFPNIVDPLDKEEEQNTIHCLSLPILQHVFSLFIVLLSRPLKFFVTCYKTIKTPLPTNRNFTRKIVYLIEACTLLLIVKKKKIEHIHVHFGTNPTAIARLIKSLGGPGYSFTVHGPTEFDDPIGFDLRGKIAEASFVVAITDYCSAQLRRWCDPGEWPKINVIHCTVGNDFFNAVQPIEQKSRTFVCVGRLTAQKGQLVLLEAFSRLITSGQSAKLVFVGDGELRPLLEQKIAESGIQEHIHITGYVSEADVRKHILKSRALVLPSFAEGLPMVIMEAFAVGRPVISTYVAGIPELVSNRKNGLLIPAGNVDALVSALAQVLKTHEDRLEKMASNGRNIVYQQHRTVIEVDKLERLFYTSHSHPN